MATMNSAQQTPNVRRCSACSSSLHGKVSYPIADKHYCVDIHCLSHGFIENIHTLEPSERDRITRKVSDMRCQKRRQIVMEKVYGVGTTL